MPGDDLGKSCRVWSQADLDSFPAPPAGLEPGLRQALGPEPLLQTVFDTTAKPYQRAVAMAFAVVRFSSEHGTDLQRWFEAYVGHGTEFQAMQGMSAEDLLNMARSSEAAIAAGAPGTIGDRAATTEEIASTLEWAALQSK